MCACIYVYLALLTAGTCSLAVFLLAIVVCLFCGVVFSLIRASCNVLSALSLLRRRLCFAFPLTACSPARHAACGFLLSLCCSARGWFGGASGHRVLWQNFLGAVVVWSGRSPASDFPAPCLSSPVLWQRASACCFGVCTPKSVTCQNTSCPANWNTPVDRFRRGFGMFEMQVGPPQYLVAEEDWSSLNSPIAAFAIWNSPCRKKTQSLKCRRHLQVNIASLTSPPWLLLMRC